MIFIDTSALIDALTGRKRSAPRLRQLIHDGERIQIPSLVLFEWRRGPRTADELSDQESLFPSDNAIVFGPAEALLAAALYKKVGRPRGREVDLAIAACAISHESRLWTLNLPDFTDVPGLELVT